MLGNGKISRPNSVFYISKFWALLCDCTVGWSASAGWMPFATGCPKRSVAEDLVFDLSLSVWYFECPMISCQVNHPILPFPNGRVAATTKCNIAEIESPEGCSYKLGGWVSRALAFAMGEFGASHNVKCRPWKYLNLNFPILAQSWYRYWYLEDSY